MDTFDGYECFRLLAAELRQRGRAAEAQALLDAMASGSTGSECLGAVGQVIRALRREQSPAEAAALEAFFVPCVKAVQSAWPRFS